MAKVFIGVGHGGKDSGAVGNGFKEKDLNLAIALKCRDELVRHGVSVKMSREKDENDTLADEIKECNSYAPDIAIDIHNNAGGGDGVEAYYHYGGGTSKILAENVVNAIVEIGQNSRGIKIRKNASGGDYYGFIRETIAPAVIVECAFVDNANDIKIIDTKVEQEAMGTAVAKGILRTLGIEYKKATATNVSPAPNVTEVGTYRVKSGDSLWKIAAEQLGDGARYNEIKELNGLISNTIYAGQELKMPVKSNVVQKPVEIVIKEGDTVRVNNPVIYGTNNIFKLWHDKYTVIQVNGDRAVIGVNGVITAPINVNNLTKI